MKQWLTTTEPRLYLLGALAFFLMVNWGPTYRGLLYLNAVATLAILVWRFRDGWLKHTTLAGLFILPVVLIVLDQFAVGHLEWLKEFRNLLLASCLALSVYLLTKPEPEITIERIGRLAYWIVILYTATQVVALTIFNMPYGTSKNPHYLALYCALCVPIAIFFFRTSSLRQRWVLGTILLMLTFCLLHTGSRPAWLALMLCALTMPFFIVGKQRLMVISAVVLIPLVLYTTDMGGFGTHVKDLAVNITKEERVAIWHDAWTMQKSSSLPQWIYGHGLDTYKVDFMAYSSWHGTADFNSPHNALLEILYLSGVLGLILFVGLYIYLYREFFRLAQRFPERRRLALLLGMLMTINVMFISITIPMMTHYNINTLAYLAGALLFLRESCTRQS